jgi:hypothetical protein
MHQGPTMKSCGDCHACCIAFAIAEVQKTPGQLCPHLTSVGCEIYAERPAPCSDFWCLWAVHPDMPDDFRPDRCGVMCSQVLRDNMVRFLEYCGAGSPEVRTNLWQWLVRQGYRPLLPNRAGLHNSVIVVGPGF